MGGLGYTLSSGPQEDRATYLTNTVTGYEPVTGARVSGTPIVLMGLYVSISNALVGTIFVQFWDISGTDTAAGTPSAVAVTNQAGYTLSSEPLTVPGGTFIWQPGDAEEVEYLDPVNRSVQVAQHRRRRCASPEEQAQEELSRARRVVPVKGFPFDKGLIVIASLIKNGFAVPAADLIRVTARVRYPGNYGGGI